MAQQAEGVYPGTWPLSQTSSSNLADTSKPAGKGPFARGNLQCWRPDSLARRRPTRQPAGARAPARAPLRSAGQAVLERVAEEEVYLSLRPTPSVLQTGWQLAFMRVAQLAPRLSCGPSPRAPSQTCPLLPSRRRGWHGGRGSQRAPPGRGVCALNSRGTNFLRQLCGDEGGVERVGGLRSLGK